MPINKLAIVSTRISLDNTSGNFSSVISAIKLIYVSSLPFRSINLPSLSSKTTLAPLITFLSSLLHSSSVLSLSFKKITNVLSSVGSLNSITNLTIVSNTILLARTSSTFSSEIPKNNPIMSSVVPSVSLLRITFPSSSIKISVIALRITLNSPGFVSVSFQIISSFITIKPLVSSGI